MQTQTQKSIRTRSWVTFGAAAAAASMALGCSGDSDPDLATFGGETPETRETLVSLARGSILAGGYLFAFGFNGQSEEGNCPARAVDGLTVTLSGNGCTDADGNEINGTIVLTNFPTDLFDPTPPDPSADTRIEYRNFSISGAPGEIILEGFLGLDRPTVTTSGGDFDFSIDADTTDPETQQRFDFAVSIKGGVSCVGADQERVCNYEAGSTGALSDLGSFAVSGSYTTGGEVTLAGTNNFVVSDVDENGCFPVTIDGAAAPPVCSAGL